MLNLFPSFFFTFFGCKINGQINSHVFTNFNAVFLTKTSAEARAKGKKIKSYFIPRNYNQMALNEGHLTTNDGSFHFFISF